MTDSIAPVADRLRSARKVFALTGAGISAESGVPTFRGAGGHWRTHRAEDLASPDGFARDPKMVWEWYLERRENLLTCEPNAGHAALVALERRLGDGFLLASQNVDGLHQRAGSERVVTLHGDIWATRCLKCGEERREPDRTFETLPPVCERCGGTLRPAVVWFGEYLPTAPIEQIEIFMRSEPPIDVMLLIGTAAMIHYIQTWSLAVQQSGALLVEVNPEDTILSMRADAALRGKAGEILPQLVAALEA